MSLLVYDAGYEKEFRELIGGVKSSISKEEYSEALSKLREAKELTNNLWRPQISEIEEKIKYLKLTRQNYKTIVELYTILCEGQGYEQLDKKIDELKEENKQLKTELEELQERLDEVEGIEDLLFDV